jgi:hypothetical protein
MNNAWHMGFSDKVSAVANRMIAADDQALGRTRTFVYIGKSGATHEVHNLLTSEAHALCNRFRDNGKIAGVDYTVLLPNRTR